MRSIPELPSGVWRHYKGPLYLLIGIAQSSEPSDDPGGELVVVYVPLYPAAGVRMRTRPLEQWREYVDANGRPVPPELEHASQGSAKNVQAAGYWPRFMFVGNRLHQDDVDESNARASWD